MDHKIINYGKRAKRRSYSRIRSEIDLPDLIEVQTKSFQNFVEEGLKDVFRDVSPIVNHSGDMKIYFGDYIFEKPKYSIQESKIHDVNYARPLKVQVRLENTQTGDVKENLLYMGDIPYMTPVGTFVINGAERVIVSQIVRSSGVYFSKELDKKNGLFRYVGQVIPTRGAWIEFETGSRDIWYGKLDRSKKIPLTILIKAFGFSKNKQITDFFGKYENLELTFEKDPVKNSDEAVKEVYKKLRQGEEVPVEGARELVYNRLFDQKRYDLANVGRFKFNKKLDVLTRAEGLYVTNDIIDPDTNAIIVPKMTYITKDVIKILAANRHAFRKEVHLDYKWYDSDVYCEILELSRKDGDKYTSYKVIGNDQRETKLHITMSDILASTSYYFNLSVGIGDLDDIDHLGNRRVRLISELLKNQFRIGFTKLEKNIKDRMSTVEPKEATPQNLINIKPLTSSLKEFFGSSQLSQFMDQINPLAELTQKRRISALGTGGLARDRAGVEVRDVHYSHYGRMCPIETPEGPSIGLITSLASYARVNDLGFIETPYLKVDKNTSTVTDEIVYLAADQEENYVIASASTKLDQKTGVIIDDRIIGRLKGANEIFQKHEIDYLDVSPKQIISVATSCIPFLEHDDASRALMGANMQRQAIPLLKTDSPIVGTGVEYKIAHDSGSCLVCHTDGEVTYVDSQVIRVLSSEGNTDSYELMNFFRSNQDTCILQRPIVEVGEKVEKGQILADGPSINDGELALGQNVTVAFMTWNGYNYEDAIVMSERLVKDDVYTSIHIEKYEIETRDTKLGKEDITREIPNVGGDALKYLDERGIIVTGAEVKEGDILVGKVTPKGQTDPTPEEKLLLAIFGEKSREVRDSSLRVPHGGGGVVHSVECFSKAKGDDLSPGVNELIRVNVIQKRKISEGDKMAGRHGNKGVISKILPMEDMPYMADGTPIDIMLNPLGVPSRMNIGQIIELHLGMAGKILGTKIATPVFDGVTQNDLSSIMSEAGLEQDGKFTLYDGRSGEEYENKITVGVMYMIKLSHMVDDKIHARSVGPYTLVTQQPMGGKAQNGGQRFGEMEVWALEAYGAANVLQEMLTIKSDDIIGRNKVFRAIVDNKPIPKASIPESFRVLTKELQSLGIFVELISKESGENEVNRSLVTHDESYISKYGFDASHNPNAIADKGGDE